MTTGYAMWSLFAMWRRFCGCRCAGSTTTTPLSDTEYRIDFRHHPGCPVAAHPTAAMN